MSENVKAAPAVTKEQAHHHWLVEMVIRLVREKPLGTIGGIIVIILLLAGVFADQLAPYERDAFDLVNVLAAPSLAHPFGCDNLGRDILTRIIYGARISVVIGLCGALLQALIAGVLGVTSGYIGGTYDVLMQRIVDAFMCFPPIFFYLAIMSVLGPGVFQVILVLGISSGIRSTRVVRSAVISVKQNVYIEAVRALGATSNGIIFRHILPNVLAPIIIIFSLAVGQMILMESTLSFLGFGVPPPTPTWGGMLSGAGRRYMIQAPWLVIWPGLALSIVVYGVNMLGDALRDLLDPRLRGGLGRFSGVQNKMSQELEKRGVKTK